MVGAGIGVLYTHPRLQPDQLQFDVSYRLMAHVLFRLGIKTVL